MRLFVTLLTVALLCATGVSAQAPQSPVQSSIPPSSSTEIDLPSASAGGGFYGDVEFLLRWFKPVCAAVPVVSVGNPQSAVPGALGQPGTQILIGGSPPHKFEFPMTPGVQFTLGWNRGYGAIGWEMRGFLMEQATNSQRFAADANGSPNAYLPYQSPDNSYQALPFTIPGVVTGGSIAVGSTQVWGLESNFSVPFIIEPGECTFFGAFLIGGRYLDLTDRVRISNALRLVDDPAAWAYGADQFSTRNQFAGPQVGTTVGVGGGGWSLELTTKFAAGITRQRHNIEGSPLLAASANSPNLVPGPFLALPSNIGTETANRVTLVPEIGVKSQFAVTSWCSLSVGYSLLYWNKVLCPGDQMSPYVNITQLPFRGPVVGARDPKPQFVHTDYFAQGMNFGLQIRF